jgi:hypothetical protein
MGQLIIFIKPRREKPLDVVICCCYNTNEVMKLLFAKARSSYRIHIARHWQLAFLTPPFLGYFIANPANVTATFYTFMGV